jgi:hypothetical protein
MEHIFPKHKCGLYLTHNEHRDYYEKLEDFIKERDYLEDFVSVEQYEKALKEDSLWVLQWYPNTPVGFQVKCACDLNELLRESNPS